ncbi:hypothetical protein SAMN02745124_00851, partial [Desulfofustis glycolicus DSM 9705]
MRTKKKGASATPPDSPLPALAGKGFRLFLVDNVVVADLDHFLA